MHDVSARLEHADLRTTAREFRDDDEGYLACIAGNPIPKGHRMV